jgi:hypothetical protein
MRRYHVVAAQLKHETHTFNIACTDIASYRERQLEKDGGRNLDCERFADLLTSVWSEVTRRVDHFIDYGQDGPRLVRSWPRCLGA